MKKDNKYGWYLPDREFRTQQLISGGVYCSLGTQGDRERNLAISLCLNPAEEICMDIGGHVGIFAKDFSKIFKETIIFEPILEHYECILKNLEDVDPCKYELHNVALGNENRDAEIYYANGNTGQSRILDEDGTIFNYKNRVRLATDEEDMKSGDFIKTRIVKLDDYINENKHLRRKFFVDNEKLGLIKIDVEGYEAAVLSGAKELIKQTRPIIMVELIDYAKMPGGYGKKVFWLMRKFGYNYITRAKKNFIFAHGSSHVRPTERSLSLASKMANSWKI
jgi:FkbM family methyltransferase